MIRRLAGWYFARCRRLDIKLLWPACVKQANGDMDIARMCFAIHAYNDPAWLFLGREAIYHAIDDLRAP